jgi:hypothetical protein
VKKNLQESVAKKKKPECLLGIFFLGASVLYMGACPQSRNAAEKMEASRFAVTALFATSLFVLCYVCRAVVAS